MEPDAILRKNIERFRQLFAGGNLGALKAEGVTSLLEKELGALAAWEPGVRVPKPPAPQ